MNAPISKLNRLKCYILNCFEVKIVSIVKRMESINVFPGFKVYPFIC